jgi:cytochrome c peroxidase
MIFHKVLYFEFTLQLMERGLALKKAIPFLLCFLLIFGILQLFQIQKTSADNNLTPLQLLGKNLFFDANLSNPTGQSCAACHGPETGFTGPDSDINARGSVYEGAVADRFGNRRPPTAAYAGESPVLYYNETTGKWAGGMFFDGRAAGWTLGDPLADQAQWPLLTPVEQNNPTKKDVISKIKVSDYASLFEEVWGNGSLNDVDGAYDKMGRAIAAYERSSEVSPFTSKYDAYLAGKTQLTELEAKGLEVFEGKAMCDTCHISRPGPSGTPPLFTDFTYWNLGVPKNPENPFYSMPSEFNPDGENFTDYGLGGFLKIAGKMARPENYPPEVYEPELGKIKVPTLRNVDLRPNPEFVKSYGHNGYFKSLEEIVNFYNTRDVKDWPKPEVSVNLDSMFVGNLGLTPSEETSIVAFLKTLSDGYVPESPTTIVPYVLFGIFVVALAFSVAFVALKKYKKRKLSRLT